MMLLQCLSRLQDYQYTLTLHSDKHSDKVLSIYHGKRAPFYWKITIQREQENGPSLPWKKTPIFLENNHTKRAGKLALFSMEKGPHLRTLGILIILQSIDLYLVFYWK